MAGSPSNATCLFSLLLSLAIAITVNGQQLCPLTGKPPAKPDSVLPRCVAERDLACCSKCDDWSTAVGVIATNGSKMLEELFPADTSFPGLDKFKETPFCGFLAGGDSKCLQLLEGLYCSIMCDPRSAVYLQVTKPASGRINESTGEVYICNAFALEMFETCKTLTFPGLSVTLGQLMPNPSKFLEAVVGPLANSATPLANLSTTLVPEANGTDTCYISPPGNVYSDVPLCCDDLSAFPSECAEDEFADFQPLLQYAVNRTLATTCSAAGGYSGGNVTDDGTGAANKGGDLSASGAWTAWVRAVWVAGFVLCWVSWL